MRIKKNRRWIKDKAWLKKGKKGKVWGNNGQLMSLEDSKALDFASVEGLRRGALLHPCQSLQLRLAELIYLAKPH
jgi:hypothetical protein